LAIAIDRNRDKQDTAKVDKNERSTTADAHHEWKFPDIAQPDGRADGRENEGGS
jgi:hypothetical protein